MASKKNAATRSVHRYTARGEDLKILGYVEAASEAEAKKMAQKRYGAKSVELHSADTNGHTETATSAAVDQAPRGGKKRAPKGEGQNSAGAIGTSESVPPVEAAATPDTTGATNQGRGAKTNGAAKDKKLSALDAAARVLEEAGQPLNCQGMIAAMTAKGYWTSPNGQTPAATLYSALLKEITKKGAASRFQKTDRGQFARTPNA